LLGERYRLGDPLGKGAMGSVHAALDTRSGRAVAIKMILPELAEDGVHLERFRREALAASTLQHPGIVEVIEACDEPPYLVMELVKGEHMPAGPMPVRRAVSIAMRLLDALTVAHAAGIVHRDLKPSNVMLEGEQPKILDFGIAKLTRSEAWQRLTRSGELMGTPAYAAPEQMRGRDVDERADLYAVGGLLYRMLTGKTPPRVPLASRLRGSFPPPPDARDLVPELSRDLSDALRSAMNAEPDMRPASAAEMRARLAPHAAAPRAGAGPRRWWLLGAAALIAGGVAAFGWWALG